MHPHRAFLAAALALTCTTSVFASPPEIVDCEAPPRDASEAMKKCYSAACDKLLRDLADCHPSSACRLAAYALYHLSIAQCQPLIRELEAEISDDLVIWLDTESDNWQVSWPGEEIPAFTPRFDFNI